MLALYHAEPGANSLKPMLCLKENGIDFISRYIDFRKFEGPGLPRPIIPALLPATPSCIPRVAR